MTPGSAPDGFKMLRYFALASLLSIVVVATSLGLLFRYAVIDSITEVGEVGNLSLARAFVNSTRTELLDYLSAEKDVQESEYVNHPLSGELASALERIMQGTAVVRVKLYNNAGLVVFSTRSGQIGRDQRDNPGFISAMEGEVMSKLIYRDSWNPLDGEEEDANLIQTYTPVRASATRPVQGVLEIYTDVEPLVLREGAAQLALMLSAIAMLALLYGFLLFIVRRGELVIARQQGVIKGRTATLEMLSAQLLSVQERERRRLATELTESLGQTLSAMKLRLESSAADIGSTDPVEREQWSAESTAMLQSAIDDVRRMAARLRPASLDELGLIAALKALTRDFQLARPGVTLELQVELEEQQVPGSLKVVIYRIVQETLDEIAAASRSQHVRVRLAREDDTVELTVEHDGDPYGPKNASSGIDPTSEIGLATMRERVELSGGTFSVQRASRSGTLIRATWPVA